MLTANASNYVAISPGGTLVESLSQFAWVIEC